MKNFNLIKRLWTDSHEKQKMGGMRRYAAMLMMLLALGVGQMWASGAIGYKGVKFTKNGTATGWYNIHNVSWGYSNSSYECRSGQTGVTDFNNANLGTVTTLKLKAFVVIGWCNGNDYVAGQLKYRLYKQSASAGSYSTYSVGNYGNNSGGAANVLVSSNDDRVVGNASLTTDIVTSSTAPGNYYLQLQGLGRMQWKDGGNSGSFSDNNGSEVKATLTVPGFTTTSTSNAYGSVNVGENSSTTISFTQHYGTTLTTGDCSLTNSTDFAVTGISETGVTVKFMPQSTGDKSCTLTITDANSKTCTITLTGTGTAASTATLTYHENFRTETGNGTGSAPAEEDYAIGATATVAGQNTMSWTHYTFSGWNTDEHITGDHYDKDDEFEITEDMDLYATWTREILMDDQGATTPVSTTVYGTYNSTALTEHTNPTKTGYTFGGWYTQPAGSNNYVISPEHVLQASKTNWTDASGRFIRPSTSTSSLYAKWTQTVSLKANTGNHGSGIDKTATATWNKTSITIPTHCSAATGYSLDGYYTAATGGTKIINADKSFAGSNITVSGDPYISSEKKWVHPGATTLYAQYTPNNYTITFSPNGGSVDPTSRSVTYDAAITNAPVPTKTGYNFTGYNTAGGVPITTNAGVFKANVDGFTDASAHWIKASGATITAQWTAKQTTVTLDPQSGSGGTESVTATYGSAMPSATMPTRLGYTFGGYYTNTGGAGTQYYTSGGASARTWNFEDATKTLYAKWTATTYTITYNLNDGANPGGVATSFTIESALITLPTPSRTGYTFGGWYGNSSFTGSAITTIAAGSTGNKEYWAKWTPKNYSITYDPVSAPEGVTYTTTPSNANCDATVDMVFTPTGDNTVIVSVVDGSSNPVAVTNPSANTYRFTMPASNVTVHVSVQSLPMVYVLKTKSGSAYFPDGFTSGGSNTQVKIWAWETSTGSNNNFFTGGSWSGYTAQSKATEYTDAHGNVWWRFIPTNTSYFTRSTPYSLIINYDNGSTTSIYESNANVHYVSDGTKRETCNSSTKTTFTGTVWVVPGGTGSHSATLYYENPSSSKKFCFVEGRFMIYTDKSRETAIYTGANKGDWNLSSTNIRMQYDETNSWYYLHTYCTPNELKSISGIEGYINLNTSPLTSSLTGGSAYYANSSVNLTAADTKINFSATSGSNRPYINNTTTNKYVVLYWDESKLWYEEEPIPAQISSISLSASRVPPMAEITATPNMSVMGTVDQAYCWGVYSDEECTSPVNVSFTSLGSGRVQFTVPQTIGTYYLKLTVRASAACNASIDDEEVQSFNVTTDNMVFFNKTDIPWSGVFVYFLGDGSYWDKDLGSGCASKDYGRANEMHRIGKSDIYYYEYSGNALGNNDIQYIAFTEYGKPNSEHFAYTNAAYRVDFKRSCAPMYVPENWITDRLNNCEYYNRGYWTTYGVSGVARNAGFTLKVFDKFDGGTAVASVDLTNTDGSNTYRATVNLTNVNYSYAYQLLSCGNKYYGNDGVMNANNSTNWKFEPDKHRCGLNSQASGNYDFIVQCTDGGEVRVSVEFPLMNGDYRLIYNDTCVYQTGWHPSQFIRHNYSDGAKLDTVSMYIRPNKQPTLKIQVCDNASSTPPTWRDSITYDVSGLTYGHGVYNFYLSQEDGKLKINDVRPYTGLYYIRTQQADGGWTGYKTNSDNVMTYTEYAEQKNYGFNYYMTKWIGATGADVTFTIANDYSESLCDTMVADPGNNPLDASQARSIPHSASVRFGWNSLTNTLHRAYINGTSIVSDRYLVMIGDAKMKDKDGKALTTEGGGKVSGLNDYEMNFTDLNNWIYRCDVKAQTGAAVRLVGNYDGHTQHFIGTAEKPEEIIGGSSGEWYLMRVTYDFKTNRLMTAWLPNGERITENVVLNADMMLIREGQEAATQVFFNGSGKSVSEIHTIFGVLEFNSENFINKFPNWSATNAYKYLMYYISFPFEVKVSEIFGCGVRGKNWIIQKYNGAKRAKIGWFAETSTFWETLPGDSVLHPYEGYLLILDRISFNDGGSKIWENLKSGGSVYLYFPSASNTSGTISEDEVTIKVPEHTCTINRSFEVDGVGTVNHKNTDSHWNVIGTPLFENKVASEIATPAPDGDGVRTLQYYYAWNSVDNTLVAQDAFDGEVTFKSMHAYMVQYAGDVTFSGAKLTPPASVAAHRVPGEKKNYRIKLRMDNESGNSSDAFVELRENACDTFALNEDMYMMRSSSKADLYTFAGNYDVAANVLSMNNHIVPVGTDVKVAGTYRFTMPSDFSGTVTLVDTETGIRTNLALSDYEVSLPKGTSNTRFLLEIDIHQMPTAIDGVGGSLKDGKAHKFIQNGQMYILQNGIIYDAQGKRVK